MLKKKQDFRDIPFFISKNAFTNDLNTIVNLSAIRQSIKNIILTNLGERTFQYNFGCNIYDTLFELMEVDDKIAIKTCEMYDYEYNVVTPEDIIIPPRKDY